MRKNPKRPESEKPTAEHDQLEMVPEGTSAGTQEKPVEIREGERVADDTGDQGGGQN